jgi:hypothetical protein
MNAAERYINRLYEQAVDRQLDLAQIRSHLAARGVVRSAFQVVDDLDNVYAFHGYAASHQPAPAQCVQAFDKGIDQGRA